MNWEFDGMWLYFDGKKSKTSNTYKGIDDINILLNLRQEGKDLFSYDTDSGWNRDRSGTQYAARETGVFRRVFRVRLFPKM